MKAIKVNKKDIPDGEEIIVCKAELGKVYLNFYDEGTYLYVRGTYYKIINNN